MLEKSFEWNYSVVLLYSIICEENTDAMVFVALCGLNMNETCIALPCQLFIKMAGICTNGIQKWIYHFNRCKYIPSKQKWDARHETHRQIISIELLAAAHRFCVLRQIIRDSINYKFFSDGVSTKVLQRAMQWLWSLNVCFCVCLYMLTRPTILWICARVYVCAYLII